MKLIKTRKGICVKVDDGDYAHLNQYKWHISGRQGNYYARCARLGKSMHRYLLAAKEGQFVDHINGDGLDNRMNNIRTCTHAQNMCNRKPASKSKYKGVSSHQSRVIHKLKSGKTKIYLARKRWTASIKRPDSTSKHIGIFDNKEDAARAYNEAAKQYQGEFARLNKV